MTRTLDRPWLERFGALVLVGIAIGLFLLEYHSSTTRMIVFGALLLAAVINAAFVLLTPIGKIEDSVLYLYSEAQPIIVNIQPQRVELTRVSELQIDRRSVLPKAIFFLPHGGRIYHTFSSRNEQRIQKFLEFIGKDVQRIVV